MRDDRDCPKCGGKPSWNRYASLTLVELEDGTLSMRAEFGPDDAFDPCSWAHAAVRIGEDAIREALDKMLRRRGHQDGDAALVQPDVVGHG